jgi:hypothetical protein
LAGRDCALKSREAIREVIKAPGDVGAFCCIAKRVLGVKWGKFCVRPPRPPARPIVKASRRRAELSRPL